VVASSVVKLRRKVIENIKLKKNENRGRKSCDENTRGLLLVQNKTWLSIRFHYEPTGGASQI